MASDAVRRFVRLSATSLSSRRRTGLSGSSFLLFRPIWWAIAYQRPQTQALLGPVETSLAASSKRVIPYLVALQAGGK